MDILLKNGQVNSEVSEIVLDKAINNRYPSLLAYFKQKKIEFDSKELLGLVSMVETSVFDSIRYIAHLYYHIMSISDDWGEPGEQQVKIAFCRNLLGKDVSDTLTQEDADQFLKQVSSTISELGIDTLSLAAAKKEFKTFHLTILGENISGYHADYVRKILKFVGSDLFFHGTYSGGSKTFILAEGYMQKYGDQDVFFARKELIRTPNAVVAIAALCGGKTVLIRQESLNTIFYQKWVHSFTSIENESFFIRQDVDRNISEGIKKHVIDLYDARSEAGLIKIQKRFVDDMAETITYHELGHGISQHDLMDISVSTVLEGSEQFGENIYSTLLEVVSDFSPSQNGIKGPMQNIVDVAKTNIKRAMRMYFMYVSDIWFFDTEDTYMYPYSDIMAILLLQFIKADLSIDFKKLEKALDFGKPGDKNQTLLGLFMTIAKKGARDLEGLARSATYELSGKKHSFDYIKKLTIRNFMDSNKQLDMTSYRAQTAFWTFMMGYVQSISDKYEDMLTLLKTEEARILRKVFVKMVGEKTAKRFGYKHHDYIVAKFKKLGILAYPDE